MPQARTCGDAKRLHTTIPLRPRDDIADALSHTSGCKVIWISSSFASRTHLARDALNLSSGNITSKQNRAKTQSFLHYHPLAWLMSSLYACNSVSVPVQRDGSLVL